MMLKRLLTLLVTAIVSSLIFADVSNAQKLGSNLREYRRYKMNRGIDDGILKRAPLTGDEKMARKAPENIDDGIFTPGRIFKSYKRTVKPKIRKR